MGVDEVLNPFDGLDVAVPSVKVLDTSIEDVFEYRPDELEVGKISEESVPVGMDVTTEVVTV